MVRGCFDGNHIRIIRKTIALPGYTGLMSLGEALESPPTASNPTPTHTSVTPLTDYITQLPPGDPEDSVAELELDDDQEAEETAQAVNTAIEDIVAISLD